LIEGFSADYVLADKGDDSNEFVAAVEETKAEPVIPPKKNRLEQRNDDKEWYKARNLVERLFQKMKHFRPGCNALRKIGKKLPSYVKFGGFCHLVSLIENAP